MLTVHGVTKFYTEDSYEEGEIGETSVFDCNLDFEAATETELLDKLMEFWGVDRDAIEINPVDDDPSRIDVSLMETSDNDQPSKAEYAAWKRGKLKLWSVFYTMNVKREEAYAMGGAK